MEKETIESYSIEKEEMFIRICEEKKQKMDNKGIDNLVDIYKVTKEEIKGIKDHLKCQNCRTIYNRQR
jgi:hypothetical protein